MILARVVQGRNIRSVVGENRVDNGSFFRMHNDVKTKALGIIQELCHRQSFTIIFLTGECPDQPI